MTDKELRKLRRDDLLQILINQQRQIDALNAELQLSKEALARREVTIQESGTLAEAALRMNGVFEAAQSAADEYLGQMRSRADALAAEAEKRSEEAQRLADTVVSDARAEAERILAEARREAGTVKREAQAGPTAPPQSSDTAEQDEADGKRRRWHLWGNKGT